MSGDADEARAGGADDPRLVAYYDRRAPEYERIYDRPERASDLVALAALFRRALAGRHALEIACGTGWWTRRLAPSTASLVAIDAGAAVLARARAARAGMPPGVRLARADAYRLPFRDGAFDAALAAFWWSHVPRARLPAFLVELRRVLAPGAVLAFADNRYVPGSSTPIARRDAAGDTWQVRTLESGDRHEVRKNFPAPDELRAAASALTGQVEITELTHFWAMVAGI